MRRLLLLVCAIIAAAIPTGAWCHTRSESHSNWLIDGGLVHLTFSVSDVEARRLTADHRTPGDAELVAYLMPRVGAAASGRPCRLSSPAKPVAAATGYRRVEFLYDCPTAKGIVLNANAFFEIVPTHVNIAQVQSAKGDFAEYVLDSAAHAIDLDAMNGKVAGAGFLTFVRMGIMHIFTGVDHMSFLLGLVLISRRFKDLAFVITGFTLGHSLTLALAVTGVIRPHAEFIDALVALTIALIGIENISVVTRRPGLLAVCTATPLFAMALLRVAGIGLLPPLLLLGAGLFASNYLMVSGHVRDAARLRLVVTMVFGLIHGFGFAADLLSEPIPTAQLAELLVGFNVGVEIGQLSVVILLTLAVSALRYAKLTLPRRVTVDLCGSFLVLIGTYWFVSRSFAI